MVIHVPNNHINPFQPLDLFVNKSVKCFLADKYQDWYTNEALKQVIRGVEPHDQKVDITLTNMKPLHAN